MNEIIIVFGISGVGKTTACRSFAARHPEFLHLSASEMLRKATNLPEQQLREADAGDILRYQSLLSGALDQRLRNHPGAKVIIDGQSIIDNGRELVRIPVATVRSLHPAALILLEAPPDKVLRRRLSSGAQRTQRNSFELALQMDAIRDAALNYADVLNIPIEIGSVTDGFELDGLVDALSRVKH